MLDQSIHDRSTVPIAACLLVGFLAVGALTATVALGASQASNSADAHSQTMAVTEENVSEQPYVEPVPGPDDEYFEAEDPDGNWISYINPRDEYRSPYLGDGSGKICVTLVNENGEFVVGESIPGTTVEVPTGESLEWHSHADPFTVEYPLTENYDRPLDADQFGTNPDIPQGDGYMDSHCMEIHGLPEDGTVEYGQAEIDGEHADDVEVVGYIQQAHDSWDTDVDPLEDAEPYEDAGGGWTYHPGGSHGQAVVVLQLDDVDGSGADGTTDGSDVNTSDDSSDTDGETNSSSESDDDGETVAESIPGFGVGAAVVALFAAVLLGRTLSGDGSRRKG